MTLNQMLGGAIVIAVIGGAILYFGGYLNVSESGVELNQAKIDAEMKASPYDAADAYFTGQQHAEALAKYGEALEAEPNNSHAPRAHYRIARCLHHLKKEAEATAAYKEYLKNYPKDSDVPKARRYLATLGG
jgi:TolA-binding protein